MFDKFGLKKDRELQDLTFRKALVTADDDIVFNTEEYFMFSRRYSSGVNDVLPDYYLNDISSAKIDKDGQLIWSRTIKKNQIQDKVRSFLSYTSAIKAKDTYFIINTFSELDKISDGRIQFAQATLKFSDLTLLHIGPDGEFNYQKILDHTENEFPFKVADGIFLQKDNAIYILGEDGKKRQLLKITL